MKMVWDLETLKKLNSEADDKTEKRYVVVYVGDWTSSNYNPQFFKDQNLYLGSAILTDNLDDAAILSKEKAEKVWDCMDVKDDWQIWSIRLGYVLDKEYKEHLQKIEKERLLRMLEALDIKECE